MEITCILLGNNFDEFFKLFSYFDDYCIIDFLQYYCN